MKHIMMYNEERISISLLDLVDEFINRVQADNPGYTWEWTHIHKDGKRVTIPEDLVIHIDFIKEKDNE